MRRSPSSTLTEMGLPAIAAIGARRGLLAGALALGLGASACGGSGSTSTTTKTVAAAPPAITKTAFITDANAICAKADPLLSEATAKLAELHSTGELAAIVRGTYVPAIQSQIRQITALGAPAGDQAAIAKMLAMVEADLANLQAHPSLVVGDPFADFARVAHPFGLTSCAPLS